MATSTSNINKPACPKCGFSYAWNGTACKHCHYPKANNDSSGSAAAWAIGIIVVLALLASLSNQDNSRSASQSSNRTYESTESTLRRVYDSQGIKHDDRMIREDARAIEQLHREFDK